MAKYRIIKDGTGFYFLQRRILLFFWDPLNSFIDSDFERVKDYFKKIIDRIDDEEKKEKLAKKWSIVWRY